MLASYPPRSSDGVYVESAAEQQGGGAEHALRI